MGENSANYIVRLPDGKTKFYGLDTGYYLGKPLRASKFPAGLLYQRMPFGDSKTRLDHPDTTWTSRASSMVFDRLFAQKKPVDGHTKIYINPHQPQAYRHPCGYWSSFFARQRCPAALPLRMTECRSNKAKERPPEFRRALLRKNLYVFLINPLWHFGQVMQIFPRPLDPQFLGAVGGNFNSGGSEHP
jgi:hypothetical protein